MDRILQKGCKGQFEALPAVFWDWENAGALNGKNGLGKSLWGKNACFPTVLERTLNSSQVCDKRKGLAFSIRLGQKAMFIFNYQLLSLFSSAFAYLFISAPSYLVLRRLTPNKKMIFFYIENINDYQALIHQHWFTWSSSHHCEGDRADVLLIW